MKTPELYPIQLSQYEARRLVFDHLSDLYSAKTQFQSSRTVYSYYAKLLANGKVEVFVHYTFDDGYVSGGGPLLIEFITPYEAATIKRLEQDRREQLVAEEDGRREEEKAVRRRTKLMKEMFGI